MPEQTEEGEPQLSAEERAAERRHPQAPIYFRVALGPGLLIQKSTPNFSGATLSANVAAAGLLKRGVAIGGNVGIHWAFSSRDVQTIESCFSGGVFLPCSSGTESSHPSLLLVTSFVTIYPSAYDGFHIDGALGYGASTYAVRENAVFRREWQRGLALGFGAGYDFWTGRQTSLGVGGRGDFLFSGEHPAFALAVLGNFTYR